MMLLKFMKHQQLIKIWQGKFREKKRNTGRKKIDIYQKSFSFTHRYNKEKFAFERLKSLKSNFALK